MRTKQESVHSTPGSGCGACAYDRPETGTRRQLAWIIGSRDGRPGGRHIARVADRLMTHGRRLSPVPMEQGTCRLFRQTRRRDHIARRIDGRRFHYGHAPNCASTASRTASAGSTGFPERAKHARAVHLDRPSTNAEIVGDLLGQAPSDPACPSTWRFARAQPRNPAWRPLCLPDHGPRPSPSPLPR